MLWLQSIPGGVVSDGWIEAKWADGALTSAKAGDAVAAVARFVAEGRVPEAARQRAVRAFADTVGVILAGAAEPAARIAQSMAGEDGAGQCHILGTPRRTDPERAAFANGIAAHALDFDDMCFVSLAHPSCALVPAAVAAGELVRAGGTAVLDAYVVGFEIECRLGMVMNPRHYHARGWHCTSSIGTVGAAAAASRVLGLDAGAARHALGIAASAACGLKENMGSMAKPLHAGLAARNGVMAARLAECGFTASARALDGPQGYLAAMDSQHVSLDPAVSDLGARWEIVETGVTVKLHASCAATHPPIDALLDLKHAGSFTHEEVEAIDIEVDSMTPRLLIHPDPATGLEAKFSMPFCAAAALVHGRLGIEMFDAEHLRDRAIRRVMPLVRLRANAGFDRAAPLSQARVTVRLRDGRTLMASADGARGYPGRLSDEELAAKFAGCAARTLDPASAREAWAALLDLGSATDVRALAARCRTAS